MDRGLRVKDVEWNQNRRTLSRLRRWGRTERRNADVSGREAKRLSPERRRAAISPLPPPPPTDDKEAEDATRTQEKRTGKKTAEFKKEKGKGKARRNTGGARD